MKMVTNIFPFPGRSGSGNAKGSDIQPVPVPKHPVGYYDLVIEQCDILVDAMRALYYHMKNGDKKSSGVLEAVWKRRDALRGYNQEMLECSSIRTTEFIEISRISVTLDMAIEHTRTIAGEILDLPNPVDRFMLKLVEKHLLFVRALNQALYKLATDPFRIEQDIRIALYERYQIEKTYRLALAALIRDKKTACLDNSHAEYLEAVSDIRGMFESRNIYRSLFRGCKRLTWVTVQIQIMATRLHNNR